MNRTPLGRWSGGRWGGEALLVLLGAAALLWPAAMAGRPAVFADTALYYSEGEYLLEALHLSSPAAEPAPRDPTRLPSRPGAPNVSAGIDGARSPLYGLWLVILQRGGGLWLTALAQAVGASLCVRMLTRAAAPGLGPLAGLAILAGLAAATALPFFTGLMMPDVFTGLAGVTLILTLTYWDRMGPLARAATLTLLGFSLGAHRSNLLDAAGLLVVGAALLAWSGVPSAILAGRGALVVGAMLAAIGGGRLAYGPIAARAGEPIASPPFLSARVLADGPGRRYLRAACRAHTPYALCRYAGLPLERSDDILWSPSPRRGVFARADAAERLALNRQDAAFATAAVMADPARTAWAAGVNSAWQFMIPFVDDVLVDPVWVERDGYWRRTSLPAIVPRASACDRRGACASPIPTWAMDGLHGAILAASLLFLAWRLSGPDVRRAWTERRERDHDAVRVARVVALAAAMVVINAVVCGALSGPFPRYQARVAWLVPFAAVLTLARIGPRPTRVRHRLRETQV